MMRLYTAGILVVLFLVQLIPVETFAQSTASPLAPGYYIVVAAYRLHQDSYAQNYVNRINKDGINSKYGADLGRKYLYVYLDYYTDFDISIREMLGTRKKAGFEKAWVRIMKDPLAEEVNLLTQAKREPQTEVPVTPSPTQTQVEEETTETAVEEKEEAMVETAVIEKEKESPEEAIEENPITEPVDLAGASVFFSLFNSTNNRQVEGEVEVVDAERARLISKVKGNDYIKLPDPKSKTGKLTLLVNVFGYRPLQHDIDYTHTAVDTLQHFIEWAGNHYLVKFDLVRYHRGDINTLFNVYFFNDAAIMLPESRYQLNSLLEMMNDNPQYRIMLHGHTNGSTRGRIVTMGPSQSFFALADDVKDGAGSAKELSKQRALVIKDWLISEGIAANRIEIKAWGGGRMLHDKQSVNAKKNVRVDVEILEE